MMRRIACSRSQAFSSEAPTMKPWKNSRSAAMIAVASSARVDFPPPRKTMSHRNGSGEWKSVISSPWNGGVLLLWRWPSNITRCASGRLSAKSRSAWSRGSVTDVEVDPHRADHALIKRVALVGVYQHPEADGMSDHSQRVVEPVLELRENFQRLSFRHLHLHRLPRRESRGRSPRARHRP